MKEILDRKGKGLIFSGLIMLKKKRNLISEFFLLATGNVFRPITDKQFRIESQSRTALKVGDLPLASTHVGTDVVVVAVNRIWNRIRII